MGRGEQRRAGKNVHVVSVLAAKQSFLVVFERL